MELKAKYSGGKLKANSSYGPSDENYRASFNIRVRELIPGKRAATIEPGDTDQHIRSEEGYYLTEVTVKRIPNDKYAHISYDGAAITVW